MAYKVDSVTGELSEYIFEIGGILALRNFTARTVGERLIIESATNANFCILDALVGEVQINGVVYDDPVQAQEKLQSLVFNPNVPVLMTSQQQQMLLGALQKGAYTGTAQDLKTLIDNHTHSWNDITDKPTFPQLNDIQIGGRNFVLKSDFTITSGFRILSLSSEFNKNLRGKTVVLSFDLFVQNLTSGGRIGIEFYIDFTDGTKQWVNAWKNFSDSQIGQNFNERFFNVITIENKEIQYISSFGAYIQANANETKVEKPKVEKGNKATDWSPAPEDIFDEMRKTLLKTTANITTNQYLEGYSQNGRTIVSQGTSNIVVTVDSEDGFVASYQKGGTGNITFQAGAGKNLIQVDGINTINGAKGSTATVTVVGNEVLLRVSNV